MEIQFIWSKVFSPWNTRVIKSLRNNWFVAVRCAFFINKYLNISKISVLSLWKLRKFRCDLYTNISTNADFQPSILGCNLYTGVTYTPANTVLFSLAVNKDKKQCCAQESHKHWAHAQVSNLSASLRVRRSDRHICSNKDLAANQGWILAPDTGQCPA